jgi:hypothetical protein
MEGVWVLSILMLGGEGRLGLVHESIPITFLKILQKNYF